MEWRQLEGNLFPLTLKLYFYHSHHLLIDIFQNAQSTLLFRPEKVTGLLLIYLSTVYRPDNSGEEIIGR